MENTKKEGQINPEDIETVTPDTENEKFKADQHKHEEGEDAVEKKTEPENQATPIENYEEATHEPLPGEGTVKNEMQSSEGSEIKEENKTNRPENESGDPGDEIETVSP